MSWLDAVKFNDQGLVPAIVQDVHNGEVLMLAYCNREAAELTAQTGFTHFYSRSRQKLWKKGESSGHLQTVREIRYDCDADTLLLRVEQEVAACHTGRRSCFFNRVTDGHVEIDGEQLFDPAQVYGGGPTPAAVLDALGRVIADRRSANPASSYVASLMAGGADRIGAKLREEAEELAGVIGEGAESAVVHEAADLLFHALVALGSRGLDLQPVLVELSERFGTSGHEEKSARADGK
ncbi:MAG: bifunctional phosphoribosyl-AMP cyclohydrolase/phosphoribosyl-ATP diphosphatase HisIE [Nitrospirota bacterium]|jgi:phosphoribosyl-ATP pyrophosphohydrolase/phosphoribosyl-AMP cyclohydrolase